MKEEAKIVIVDDDPTFVEIATASLKTVPYRVEAAYNKEDGMKKIRKNKPDLVILDVMMEEWDDGFKMCRELKDDPELKQIPVLMLTAVTKETGLKFSPLTDGEYLPAQDLMNKPIKPADLLKRVRDLLNKDKKEMGKP